MFIKRTILWILLGLAYISSQACGSLSQDSAYRRLVGFCQNIVRSNRLFSQEKVYLHLDNNGYYTDEKIWFKAYVFEASSLLPTDMSRVLYVELLNPNGQIVERQTLPIINGRTYGCLSPDTMLVSSGFYEVRAYTRAMLNWDDAYIFSRVVPIYDRPPYTVRSIAKMMEHQYETKSLGFNRTTPRPIMTQSTRHEGGVMMAFYPEGGNILKGVTNTLAYKVTDNAGHPLNTKIRILSDGGEEVALSVTLHEGMGKFDLPPSWNGGCAVLTQGKKDVRFKLPATTDRGCSMQYMGIETDSLMFKISPCNALRSELVGVTATCRGALCYFDTIRLDQQMYLRVPSAKLHAGINQVTMFTKDGEIVCERLVWNASSISMPQLAIRQNKTSYSPFSPIALDISLSDAEGKPIQGEMSLSVRDDSTVAGCDGPGIMTEMLLSSDLKGYIHNPEYYFATDDSTRIQALDLLLMVQGWRRYDWHVLTGIEKLNISHPVEEGLLFQAQLANSHHRGQDESYYNLNFLMTTDRGTKIFSAKSKADGTINVMLPDFDDDAPTILTITDNKDKRKDINLKLMRNFYPMARPYEPIELCFDPMQKESKNSVYKDNPTIFEWQDTITDHVSKLVSLNGVSIKGRHVGDSQAGSRYTWAGGPQAFKSSATYLYDLEQELDRYQDTHYAPTNVWEWLCTVNPNFDYTPATKEMIYRGRPIVLKVDNGIASRESDVNLNTKNTDDQSKKREKGVAADTLFLMEDYKYLAIVEDAATVSNTFADGILTYREGTQTPTVQTSQLNDKTLFVLYSNTSSQSLTSNKRGIRKTILHGYSTCEEFYSPDYRNTDLPTPDDHRRTLYWNPSLVTDTNGKANVLFYSNSNNNVILRLNAQGITINGEIFQK